jgi:hypothetical protein
VHKGSRLLHGAVVELGIVNIESGVVGLRHGFCYTSDDGRPSEEKKMRRAFVSIQEAITIYLGDMTLCENITLGDFGSCRRR